MTASEYTSIMTRIDLVGAENRDDIHSLTEALALTRVSLAACQGRCWVQASSRTQIKGFMANFLVAAFGATVAYVLNRAWR
ncbi:MAG TPA: hypothetical protein VJ801_07330 [Polyangia bacterium]|jgi:hypothetical protein|nr:hypothetical protein [Polyangia bacterium]